MALIKGDEKRLKMHKQCYAIGGRINFNYRDISLCHGIDIGDQIIWSVDDGKEFSPELYKKCTQEITEQNQSENPYCKGCSNLMECEDDPKKIDVVTINPMYFCQCKCVYCVSFSGKQHSLYNPLPYIKKLIDAEMISKTCLFDWGGGEPTLSDDFEEIFVYLLKNRYMQRVNTNAIILNQVLFDNLNNDLVSLRISLDSGNEKTYLATKGRNLFQQVIKNISEYRKRSENILLKYVVTNTNSEEKSIRDFVDIAVKLHIKAICIDTDLYSYGNKNYVGLLRFTEKELAAAKMLQRLAHEYGLNVQIGYVWTAQNKAIPSRDYNQISDIKELIKNNEIYELPCLMSDFNKDRKNDFKNEIIPVVLPSMEAAVRQIKEKKVVLYGAGKTGKKLLSVLKKQGFKISYFCDKYKGGQMLDGVPVLGTEDGLYDIDDDTVVILTPLYPRNIVIDFNKQYYIQLKDKLYFIKDFNMGDD